MRKDYIRECATPEERERTRALYDIIHDYEAIEGTEQDTPAKKKQYDRALTEDMTLYKTLLERYSKKDPDEIMADIKEALGAVTIADFQEYYKAQIQKQAERQESTAGEEKPKFKKLRRAELMRGYIQVYVIFPMLQALGFDPDKNGERLAEAFRLSNELVEKWCPKKKKGQRESSLPPGNFVPMLNGPIMRDLVSISTNRTKPEQIKKTGAPAIKQGNTTIYFGTNPKTGEPAELKVSTIKLLNACRMYFTAKVHYKDTPNESQCQVAIPLEEYTRLCGKPTTKTSLDNMRKKIWVDLYDLRAISIEGAETRGKRVVSISQTSIIYGATIERGYILVKFVPEVAEYLANAFVSQFYKALMAVDERNPNSFYLGMKLADHASIDNNIINETADIISVKSLLEACPELPSYEEVMQSGRDIDHRIIKPFEMALDNVPGLKWEYCQGKGKPLTDEQAQLKDYETFLGLYIHFTLEGEPDQAERIERKKKEIEKRKKKAEKRAEKRKEQQAKKDG